MRNFILLASTAMLAACGGAGPETVGGSAPPTTGGGGGPIVPGGKEHSFVDPTEVRTYRAIGASHNYEYGSSTKYATEEFENGTPDDPTDSLFRIETRAQENQIYRGNATTVRDSNISVTFNPRDAIFEVQVTDDLSGASTNLRFQDPLHRTDFGGALEPQGGVPNLTTPGINYLQAGGADFVFFPEQKSPTARSGFVGNVSDIAPILVDGAPNGFYDVSTFFYQTPGTETQFVTFAGYLRNNITLERRAIPIEQRDFQLEPDGSRSVDAEGNFIPIGPSTFVRNNYDYERGAFVFGEQSTDDSVPTVGTGSFEGAMLASMVFDNLPDDVGFASTFFQWIEGRAKTTVDFGSNTFELDISGTVFAPEYDLTTPRITFLPGGSTFDARGNGDIDLVGTGGFFGQFNSAWFVRPDGERYNLDIAGSSVNGAFYGPNAEEVGGGFRIVGGTPDERIDILGTFVGDGN